MPTMWRFSLCCMPFAAITVGTQYTMAFVSGEDYIELTPGHVQIVFPWSASTVAMCLNMEQCLCLLLWVDLHKGWWSRTHPTWDPIKYWTFVAWLAMLCMELWSLQQLSHCFHWALSSLASATSFTEACCTKDAYFHWRQYLLPNGHIALSSILICHLRAADQLAIITSKCQPSSRSVFMFAIANGILK